MRHAESVSNASKVFPDESISPSLTERGVQQARAVAEELSNLGVEAVYSSPMLRTRQTAEKICDKLGLKFLVDDRLREIGLGKLAGKSHPEIRSIDPEWYKEYFNESSVYGLEKFVRVMDRMFSAVVDVSNQGKSCVVFVSHVEPIRALVAASLGIMGEWVRRIRVSNASITVFNYTEGVLRLRVLNWLPLREYSDQSRV